MGKILDFEELRPQINGKNLKADINKLDAATKKAEAEQAALDKLVSVFQKSLTRQRKKLKKKNQTLTDSAGNIAILTSMLKMTLKMLPIAEKQYQRYKNERAAYAIVAITSQARELSADIQRLGGAASAAPVIINNIIMPNFQHLLQNTLNEGSVAIKTLKATLPRHLQKPAQEIINVLVKNQSKYISEINLAISEKVEKYFDEK